MADDLPAETLARIRKHQGPICPWCNCAIRITGHADKCPAEQLTGKNPAHGTA